MKKIIYGSIALMIAIIVACSVSSQKELDKKVKDFLFVFKDKLRSNDEEILALFSTKQSKDEILKAIAILQNKDTVFVKVKALFEEASAYWEDSFLKVEVPIEMIGSDKEVKQNKFAIKLFQRGGRYYVGQLEADEMYKQYLILKAEDEGSLARRMADIKVYYDKAKELQKNCDSVIWYAHHKNMTYYYAVKGVFNFDSLKKGVKQEYKMGLLDETGKVIVPFEFDLIGNPSLGLPETFEVKRDGKIGYYTLSGKEIAPAVFEWVIPYDENGTIALAKKDSIYGWIDKNFVFNENFPSSQAEQWVKGFKYLTENTFSFGGEYNDLIRILYPLSEDFQYRAAGMIIPPSYFVTMRLFPLVDEGFLIKNNDSLGFQYGKDFIVAKSQKPFSISSLITGFIAEFKNRFIGGRGEFYTNKSVVLVDQKENVLSTIWIGGGGFESKKINDTLYQYSFLPDLDNDMGPGDNFPEMNYPMYGYFMFDGKKVNVIESNRRFAFTKFNKLDSSYLTGDFKRWDNKTETFLSNEALSEMRNEILADYGFIFIEKGQVEWYKYQRWYKPTIESYEEVYAKASEIDKYNLDFLNRLIGSTPDSKSM